MVGLRERHSSPRPTGIDRSLRWALLVTVVLALAALVGGTVTTYRGAPPIPDRAIAPGGETVFTRSDVLGGRAVFQRTDLMDFGSLYGNGAYFGPDWGSDYLHREVSILRDLAARDRLGRPYAALGPDGRGVVDALVAADLKTNRYSSQTGTLALAEGQVVAYRALRAHYRNLLMQGDRNLGLQRGVVANVGEADRVTAFLAWTAWTSSAERPGGAASYTNNWPYEPGAGNDPTAGMWQWTWVSIAAMVLLGAAVVWVYRRFIAPGTDLVEAPSASADLPVTPSQASTWKWLLLVPGLLLLQGVAGVVLAHYYADRGSFYGLDIRSALPFSVLKAGHLQLAIAWIAAAWLGAGLFLAPLVGGREPRRQRLLANVLWAAVMVVVVGALVGIYLGVTGRTGGAWRWVGSQGLEYIQLGRAFQIALFGGLLIWAGIMLRAFWPGLRERRSRGSLEHLLLYSGVAIAGIYGFGMLSGFSSSATLSDYWRWWVVHLWVENAFEFFTVAVVGYALLSMGLLSRRLVERVVYFELILIFGAGILGTGHHFYWAGEPSAWIAVGATFSMLEVIPLVLMLLRAWGEYRAVRAAGRGFPQRTAFLFFTSAAVWNLVGAGLLGGIINPPIASYYEHGTFLTLAHGHASMFGVFGMLALGLTYFALRGLIPGDGWSDRAPSWVLRLFNASIVLWLALNLLPVGVAQMVASIQHGFWYSRSLAFYNDWSLFQWLRLAGDVVFLGAGLLMLWDVVAKLRRRRPPAIREGEDLRLPPSGTARPLPGPAREEVRAGA